MIGRWWRELLRYGGVVLLGALLLQGWMLSWWLLERTWQRLWGELQLQLFCPTEEQALELRRWLSAEPLVAELRQIPPQQGWRELQRWLGVEAELPQVPDSLLPSVLIARLHMEAPNRIAALLERVSPSQLWSRAAFPSGAGTAAVVVPNGGAVGMGSGWSRHGSAAGDAPLGCGEPDAGAGESVPGAGAVGNSSAADLGTAGRGAGSAQRWYCCRSCRSRPVGGLPGCM
jgi:hypothetical protein